jgi:hypothetical protein
MMWPFSYVFDLIDQYGSASQKQRFVTLELRFKNADQRKYFTAQLIDGWGENLVMTKWGEGPYIEGMPISVDVDGDGYRHYRKMRRMYPPDPEPIGPITPRPARDQAEGEAIAPTDHDRHPRYCPESWKHSDSLICTRPDRHRGDHIVGSKGMIVARWPRKKKKRNKRGLSSPKK